MPLSWSDILVAVAVWAALATLAACTVFFLPLWQRRHRPRHRRPAWWRGNPPQRDEIDSDPPVTLRDLVR
jgi:hypothetical protein